MEFAVLGPVEVRIDGRMLPLGGPKQRALLALLVLNANEVVSRDRLVSELWGERAPASAQRSLDTYIYRLRMLLGGERIERRGPAYRLRLEPDERDLDRFEALLEQGRAAAAADDPAAARDRLRDALSLWRGRALADLASESSLALEAERLLGDAAIHKRLQRQEDRPRRRCAEPGYRTWIPITRPANKRYCAPHAAPAARVRRHRRVDSRETRLNSATSMRRRVY